MALPGGLGVARVLSGHGILSGLGTLSRSGRRSRRRNTAQVLICWGVARPSSTHVRSRMLRAALKSRFKQVAGQYLFLQTATACALFGSLPSPLTMGGWSRRASSLQYEHTTLVRNSSMRMTRPPPGARYLAWR